MVTLSDKGQGPKFSSGCANSSLRPQPLHKRGRDMNLFRKAALLTLVALIFGLVSATAGAAPLRVRVRGAAKLSARASRDQAVGLPGISELVLSGSLTDDAGQPLAFQSVIVRVTREADPHDPRVADGLRAAHGCDKSVDVVHPTNAWGVTVGGSPESPEIIASTDDTGRFCFRARIDPDRYKATLIYTPKTGFVDATERELRFDLTKRSLALRFDPTPKIIPLDTALARIDAVAIIDDDATPRVAPGLALVLANEREELGKVTTDASGRAKLVVPGTKLGPPGPGELRVSFAGDAETSPAIHVEDVERHVKVVVKVPAAERSELKAAVPEDGIPLTAEITSSLGPVSEGSVEARIGDVLVGAAPVERGVARLMLTFTAQGSEALVRLRYVQTSPWYEPLGEPTIRVPIRGPGLWSKAPVLIAGLVVLAFFLFGRVSAQKSKPAPSIDNAAPIREGKPRVEVVRAAERGYEGWTGRVVDAHEGTPVRNARVWIERGTFEGRTVLASTETDRDGRFNLPGIGPPGGDEQIAAEGRLYARHAQALPAAGEISIALQLRKRALLARLVKWARRRGPPFDVRPEPTPGHVRRAASGEFNTARWADAIERAVFGPSEVDARAEQEIERLTPEIDRDKANSGER